MQYIYREIHTQFTALEQTLRHLDENIEGIAKQVTDSPLVFLGSGSSFSIAQSAAVTTQMHLGRRAMAIAAGDLLLHTQAYRHVVQGCTLIALSRSGETSEIILCIRKLRDENMDFRVLSINCANNSTLSHMSALTIELPWAFDQSVCQTRTATNLYFACVYIIAKLSHNDALLADLTAVVQLGEAFIAGNEQKLQEVAQLPWEHAVVLGDAEIGGVCDEGALAFKEICQQQSNYYHLLDVRHGPIVLINEQTLVIAVLSGSNEKYELDLVRDLQKRGAHVLIYSDTATDLDGVYSVAFGRRLHTAARGVPAIVTCQLVSYFKSFITGVDPDQPEGLSPWISL